MKYLIIIIAFSLMGTRAMAQAEKLINFGVGMNELGNIAYIGYEEPTFNNISTQVIFKADLPSFNYFILGIGANYYFDELLDLNEKFDFYGGISLGSTYFIDKSGMATDSPFNFRLGIQGGGRWYWAESWALQLEAGGGTGYDVQLGISYFL